MHFTDHAELRCAQRNLSKGDVLYVLEHGLGEYNAGVRMHFLRRRDVPLDDLSDPRIERLIGVCVLVARNRQGMLEVITLYHNAKSGLKDHRRKSKYNRHRHWAA